MHRSFSFATFEKCQNRQNEKWEKQPPDEKGSGFDEASEDAATSTMTSNSGIQRALRDDHNE